MLPMITTVCMNRMAGLPVLILLKAVPAVRAALLQPAGHPVCQILRTARSDLLLLPADLLLIVPAGLMLIVPADLLLIVRADLPLPAADPLPIGAVSPPPAGPERLLHVLPHRDLRDPEMRHLPVHLKDKACAMNGSARMQPEGALPPQLHVPGTTLSGRERKTSASIC